MCVGVDEGVGVSVSVAVNEGLAVGEAGIAVVGCWTACVGRGSALLQAFRMDTIARSDTYRSGQSMRCIA